jgi:hypothetical protein
MAFTFNWFFFLTFFLMPEGADHFDEFRSFRFFGVEKLLGGKTVTVGAMQCHPNYRSVF